MKHFFNTIFLSLFIFNSLSSQVPDSSFNKTGKKVLPAYSEFEELRSALLQQDGKIVLGGYDYEDFFYYPSISVFRINKNGTLDKNFGAQGHVRFNGSPHGGSEYGGAIALQPDNKIVGTGTDFDRNGEIPSYVLLFRLKQNGEYDSTFGKNGKAYFNFGGTSCSGNALVIKSDGKIVVTGSLTTNYGSGRAELVQFLPNGKIDKSFGTNGLSSTGISARQTGMALMLLPGDKILAGFNFTAGGATKTGLVKYNADGTVDSNFGHKGLTANKNINAYSGGNIGLAVQADRKILEYATVDKGDGINYNNILYRYNANGSPDNTFGVNGYIILPFFTGYGTLSVTVDRNQRILISGPGFGVSRYLSNGQLDSSFGVNGILSADLSDVDPNAFGGAEAVIIQPDSKIVFAGYVDSFDGLEEFGVARFKMPALNQQSSTANLLADKFESISIYPNPVNDVLNVKGLDANAIYDLKITDAKGSLLAVKKVNGESLTNWNVQHLSSGFYYLSISFNGQTRTFKFFKE